MKKRILFIFLSAFTFFIGLNGAKAYLGEFTFTLDDNGGKGGSEKIYVSATPDDYHIYADAAHKIEISSVDVPIKDGYSFEGYYIDQTKVVSRRGSVKQLHMATYISKIKDTVSDIKVTAKWSKLAYKVKLTSTEKVDSTGTEYFYVPSSDETYPDEGVAYSKDSIQIDRIDIPTRKGYKFMGYEPIKYEGEDYSTISDRGVIEAVAYPEKFANASKYNVEGYKIKSVALAFQDGKAKEITLKAIWKEKKDDPIEMQTMTLSKSNITLGKGKITRLRIKYTPRKANQTKVTYKSSDEKVASVSADGRITGIRVGTTTITVTSVSNPKLTATCEVLVTNDGNSSAADKFLTVEIDETKALPKLDTFMKPTDDTSSTEPVTLAYQLKDPNDTKIKIDAAGNVTGLAAGISYINVVDTQGRSYGLIEVDVIKKTESTAQEEKEEQIEETEQQAVGDLPLISCSLKDNYLKVGDTIDFKSIIYNKPAKTTVKYSLDGGAETAIGTGVLSNGFIDFDVTNKKIVGKAEGYTFIKITAGKTEKECQVLVKNELSQTDKFNIQSNDTLNSLDINNANINPEDAKITGDGEASTTNGNVKIKSAKIKASKKTIKVGSNVILNEKVTVSPKGTNYTVSWKSSNKAVATVNKKTGKVVGKSAGKAKITLTVKAKGAKKKTDSVKITVKKKK